MASLGRDEPSPDKSISYLDLEGNFVVWVGEGKTVVLDGHHFHDALTLVTLVISAWCLVAFIAIIIWLLYVYVSRKSSRRILRWYGVGLSTLSMAW
jgi:hypothetical protein